MSGGGKSKSGENNKTAPTEAVVPVATMQTFGGILDPQVTQQLAASGLLGTVSNAGLYQGASIPMLRTPDDVRNYLASQGKSYVNNNGAIGTGAVPAGGSAPATATGSAQSGVLYGRIM